MLNLRLLSFIGVVALAGSTMPLRLRAQAYTPPPPPLDAPCKPTKKDPCTIPPSTVPPAKSTMAFPFPGDTTDAVSLDPNAKPDDPSSKPSQPAAPDSNGKFPFPDTPGNGAAPPSSSSDSSSSSSGSGSSSSGSSAAADDDDPPAPTPVNRRHLPKVEDLDAREAKDLEVSSYYFSTGNYLGAYSRGKDAVRLMPNDAEAHFVLAQAANSLKKVQEARDEYQLSLKLDVGEDHARIARTELARLH